MIYDEAYFRKHEASFAGREGTLNGIAESIHKAFPDATSILEVGCGRGYITQHLENLYPAAEVQGVDISGWAAHNHLTRAQIIRADITQHIPLRAPGGPIRFNKFRDELKHVRWHLVLSWQVLEHMENESAARSALLGLDGATSFAMIHSIRVAESGAGDDPSHTLMRSRAWWLEEFAALGWFVDPAWQLLLEWAGQWRGTKELFVLRRG